VSDMVLWKRIVSRRQRKAHERYLAERELQEVLQAQDVGKAVLGAARGTGVAQQGMNGQN
jgi:hypothetical protein